MNKYIITFGSAQLQEFKIDNPMKVMLILEDKDEWSAREQLMDTPIKRNFCTSYPYKKYHDFKTKYGMYPITLDQLMEKVRDEY